MGSQFNPRPILDAIYEEHSHARILFITPEAVASISDDNAAIKAVLEKLCVVNHIVQTDALNFPNFTIYDLCVLGSESDIGWTDTNLADIKTVPRLPILCFDKVAAIYLKMGVDGGDATTKTTIDVSAKIEASLLGIGSQYKNITGLDAGVSTVSTSATYHTLDMSHANLTEVVYATADIDVDTGNGGTPQSDVVIGFLPSVLEDSSIGLDTNGAELPATLAFYGAGYEAAKLTTLGLAVIYLACHILIHAQKKPVEIAGTIANLRRLIIGNMGSQFGNATPLVEWIVGQNTAGTKLPAGKSLVDLIDVIDGIVDTITGRVTGNVALASVLEDAMQKVSSSYNQDTDSLEALSEAIAAIATDGVPTSTDWKGSFSWVTASYTTNEQDISTLFSEKLDKVVRRKYSVKLDLTAVEADGSFDELYLAVKEEIDGSNYRAIDRKTVTKAQIAATAEPGIVIDIPATSENIQITMQMKTALAGDATIYYAVVKEHLE